MDVHNTVQVSKHTGLVPGMIITVEPGIYIPSDWGDVPEEFRGIGVRIEDDVLIAPKGYQVLSQECPKEVEDVERTCKSYNP